MQRNYAADVLLADTVLENIIFQFLKNEFKFHFFISKNELKITFLWQDSHTCCIRLVCMCTFFRLQKPTRNHAILTFYLQINIFVTLSIFAKLARTSFSVYKATLTLAHVTISSKLEALARC